MPRRRRTERRHRSDFDFPYFDGQNELVRTNRRVVPDRRFNGAVQRLLLMCQGEIVEVTNSDVPVIVGRANMCDVVTSSIFASRIHARIECRGDEFYIIDQSRNGTYIQVEDQAPVKLLQTECPLWGYGFISLGRPIVGSNEDVIRFSSR